MKKQCFVICILTFGFMLALAGSSWAMNHLPHKGHMHHSPFGKMENRLSLHCLMKGHNLNAPCPHFIGKGSSEEISVFSSTCGNNAPKKSPLSTSVGSSPFFNSSSWSNYDYFPQSWRIQLQIAPFLLAEISLPDPPPKVS